MYSCFLWFLVVLIFLEVQYNLFPQLSCRQGSVHPWMVIITYYQITIQFNTQNDCWLHMNGFCFSCELGLSVTMTTIKFKVHTPPMSRRWENQKYSTYQALLLLFFLHHTCTPSSLRGVLPLFVLQRFSWVWFCRSLGQEKKKSPNPLFLSAYQAIGGGGLSNTLSIIALHLNPQNSARDWIYMTAFTFHHKVSIYSCLAGEDAEQRLNWPKLLLQ